MTATPDAPTATPAPAGAAPVNGVPHDGPARPVPPGPAGPRPRTLRDVLRALRRNWPVLLVAAVFGAAAGWGVAAATPERYETQTKVLITPDVPAAAGGAGPQAAELVSDRMETYAALVQTPVVLDPAIESSGVDVASTALADDVTATVVPRTTILTITVSADSGQDAAELANAISASLVDQVEDSAPAGSPLAATGSVVEAPVVLTEPTSPDLRLHVAIGLAAGLVVGFLVAAAREALAADPR